MSLLPQGEEEDEVTGKWPKRSKESRRGQSEAAWISFMAVVTSTTNLEAENTVSLFVSQSLRSEIAVSLPGQDCVPYGPSGDLAPGLL